MLNKYLKRKYDMCKTTNIKKEVKICLLGDAKVGKTKIIDQFIKSTFNDEYTPTIESRQNVLYKFNNKQYDIQLFDTAGSNELNLFVSDSISQCEAFIIFFSLTDRNSLSRISHYKKLIKNVYKNQKMPIILCSTKSDMIRENVITKNECKDISIQYKVPLFITSSKSKETLIPMFKKMVGMVINKEKRVSVVFQPPQMYQLNKKATSSSSTTASTKNNTSTNNTTKIDQSTKTRLDNEKMSLSHLRVKKYLKIFT